MDESVVAEIVEEAKAILLSLEGDSANLSGVALRARRLADLVGDDEASQWLRLECEGVGDGRQKPVGSPMKPPSGSIDRFARNRSMVNWAPMSQSEFISVLRSQNTEKWRGIQPRSIHQLEQTLGTPFEVEDPAGDPVEDLMKDDVVYRFQLAAQQREAHQERQINAMKSEMIERQRIDILKRISCSIHDWATSVYIAYRLRLTTGNVFDRFKGHAETMLGEICPDAAKKLEHAVRRLSPSSEAEEWSAAAGSCRRLLKDVADALFPATDEKRAERDLSTSCYKNRLWAWIIERKSFAPRGLAEQSDALCARVDDLYDKSSKGVHADLTRQEAEYCVVQTYLLVAGLAELRRVDFSNRSGE